jgi:hypothetical protein
MIIIREPSEVHLPLGGGRLIVVAEADTSRSVSIDTIRGEIQEELLHEAAIVGCHGTQHGVTH